MKSYTNYRRKLNRQLAKHHIEFECHKCYEGYQWTFPKFPGGDAVIHNGSYGHSRGWYETYCMPWDNGDVTPLPIDKLIEKLLGEY